MTPAFRTENFYRPASIWTKENFGKRIQKIPVDGGFTCPNRDGKLSKLGCLYCNNKSFTPFYTDGKTSISQQLKVGIDFFSRRYNCDSFFAYFQTFSGTYGAAEILEKKYKEALAFPEIKGLIISTRPDCINEENLDLLKELKSQTYVRLEVGVESFEDKVLNNINRCHDVKTTLNSLEIIEKAQIDYCVHLIFGLPYESYECAKDYAKILSSTKASFVKLHHLQIVKGSRLERIHNNPCSKIKLHSLSSYIETLSEFLAYLKPDVYIERFINRVPKEFLIAPSFGGINEKDFAKKLCTKMSEKNIFQGVFFSH